MTEQEARRAVVQFWMTKADQALASAHSEFAAKRYDFAANRIYYACFYAASAVLLQAGRKFVKHTGVRGALYQNLVRPGKLDAKWGKLYDRIFDARQSSDYLELFEIGEPEVSELLRGADGFVTEMKRLLAAGNAA
jgi:uncharacterized protein (UPF0332 family)